MITKNVKLYLGDGFPVRIPVSQFDTMWQFVFTIIHNSQLWQIPTGATAVLNGKKPDGNVFAFSGTIENNTVTVDADVQMTACAGDTICELSILADGKTVGTANFTLAVESAPNSTGATPGASDVDAYGAIISGELDTYFEQHPEMIEGKGLSEPIRLAILNCFRHVAWVDEHGGDYYNALYDLLINKEVVSITAVFTQGSAVIYDTDSLDTLRQYLTVTALYDDGTTATVTTYVLSGTLAEGTSTITVSYGGKTTTFIVTVSAGVPSDYTEHSYISFIGSNSASLPRAALMPTKTYDNLNAISVEFDYVSKVGTSTGSCILGGRTATGATSSLAFYTKTDSFGFHVHGSDTTTTISQTQNVNHKVVLTNRSASPSTITFDGTEYSIAWTNSNTINTFLSLFTNQQSTASSFYGVPNIELGRIIVRDLSGNAINEYVPCVRNSDSVIGLYDIIEKTFYTCSTASYATVGNSNCKYKVGEWS